MKTTLIAAALALGVLAAASPRSAQAAPTPSAVAAAPVEHIFVSLLAAIKADDYAAFVADGEPAFKAALTKSMLTQVSTQIAPRLAKGYHTVYLGQLTQRGYQVSLWKIVYTDGGDDSLASLSLKAGKVGGFFIN